MTTSRGTGSRILIVEDEGLIALDIEKTLQDFGFEVVGRAVSGEEALRCAEANRPDLALLDVHLRGEPDGIETAAKLSREQDIAIAYLTAYSDLDTVERMKRMAPAGMLLKPFKPLDLFNLVEMALFRARVAQAERLIHDRERFLATTLCAIGEGVIATDASMAVTFMNTAAERLTGWTFQDAAGHPIQEVLPLQEDDTGASLGAIITEAMWSRAACRVDSSTFVARDGVIHNVIDTIAPILEDSATLGTVVVLTDVTKQRRAARQLEVGERMASLRRHSGAIGHDINNALAVIAANLHYARGHFDETSPDSVEPLPIQREAFYEVGRALADAATGAERIKQIATRLKLFGGDQPSPDAVDVIDVMQWALSVTERERTGRARLVLDLERVPRIEGDEARIGHVFVEVLGLAAARVRDGSAERDVIRVGTRRDAEGWALVVVSNIRTTSKVGDDAPSGLIVGVVRDLGGTIESVNRSDGTRDISVRFPPARTVRLQPAWRWPPASEAQPRGKVLVVDDDELVGQVVARVLSSDHDVVTARSGAEAIGLITGGCTFDAVVCDVVMPEMSGIELYYWIRTQAPEVLRSFMFLTGGAIDAKTSAALAGLVEPRMAKPFHPPDLKALVGDLVRRRRV